MSKVGLFGGGVLDGRDVGRQLRHQDGPAPRHRASQLGELAQACNEANQRGNYADLAMVVPGQH